MATGCRGDERRPGDDLQRVLNHEDRLRMLSEGSFRCRPCRICGNSDPLFIELEEGQSGDGREEGAGNGEDAEETKAAHRLKCKRCNQPYTLSTSDDEDLSSFLARDGDGDDGLDLVGIECCKCNNKEPDCFSVSRYDNGHLRSITCLNCDHGNTFHESDACAGSGPFSNDGEWGSGFDAAAEVEFSGEGIECIKCPNTDAHLFDVTLHPDGRIHKITCMVCGHGNTFRTQPEQVVATCNDQGGWLSWSAFSSAAQVLALPVLSVAQSLVQKSAQSTWNQVSQQVSDNVQSNRPMTEGLRQVGAGQVAAIGRNLVLELGDTYLKKLLPMIPDTARKALARNLSEVVSQLAMKLLEKKKAPVNANTSTDTNTPAKAKPPPDT